MGIHKQFEAPASELGRGRVRSAWSHTGNLLAVTGQKGKVMIMNRQGKLEHQFMLVGVSGMQWDPSSDTLAIISDRNTTVSLYQHSTKKTTTFDAGVKELCFLQWSLTGAQLVVCAHRGAIVLYNRSTAKKVPIVGTHSQNIVDGAWTPEGQLVMVSADRTLSVSDAEGNLISTTPLGGNPTSVVLLGVSPTAQQQSVVAAVNLGSTIQIIQLKQPKDTFAAQFHSDLGSITALSSAADYSLILGFASGAMGLATLSGNELSLVCSINPFRDAVKGISFASGSGLCAAVGDNTLRIFGRSADSIKEMKDLAVQHEMEFGSMGTVEWSPDGQNISLGTMTGNLYSYSMKVLNVSCAYDNYIFYFVSARMITVKNTTDGKAICTVAIDCDPTMMAAGKDVIAVGAGNKVLVYECHFTSPGQSQEPGSPQSPSVAPSSGNSNAAGEPQSKLLSSTEYSSPISGICVNSRFLAVMFDGQVQLQPVVDSPEEHRLILPPAGEPKVVAMGMSDTLFMYASGAKVCVYALQNLQVVAEYTCRTGLKRAFPNGACTRIAYIDDSNSLWILNPITEVASQAEGFEAECNNVLWDNSDSTIFTTFGPQHFVTFVCSPHSRHGATCESILVRDSSNDNLRTPLPSDYRPVTLNRGLVFCQSNSGMLDSILLRSHNEINSRVPNPEAFYNNFSLNRLRWSSQNISTPQEAEDLAVKALHMLDIELAIRVYRQLSQPSLVLCLEKIKHIHEKNLLIGHVSMIMGYFKDAQSFFLRSSQPLCALEMRRDLMQWEPALALAGDLAPERVPIVSMEYAQQLEYRGDYVKALEMYKNGEREMPTGNDSMEMRAARQAVEEHNAQCQEGTARCYIRTGSIKEGSEIASKSTRKTFIYECAQLCEDNFRYDDAAQLYEKAGDMERAATLYIERSKNLKAAARILPELTSRNIIVLFATAKENEGSFAEAAEAYAQAGDWDNVVRLKVEKLNDLHGAYRIVIDTRSADAAALVAKVYQARGEYGTAVEFLVLGNSTVEAMELARKHNCMANFEKALLGQVRLVDGVSPKQYQQDFALIAEHYEKAGKAGQAALFYHIAGNYAMALKKYLEAGEPEDIEKAVEVVGKARSDSLTNRLIDYLMGEADGEPKEPSYIFKLYMALGSFEKAAKTSVIIATKEQEVGNYRGAHKTLVDACRILRDRQMRVPNDLRRTLMLVHSYIIVKDLIKVMKDEDCACRMLLRVSRNIQKFPKHVTTIVTSTVLQCLKADFKKSAFEFACFLIQNKFYRTQLEEKNRKKIEGVVRRRGAEELVDPADGVSPCPFCDAPVADTDLDCGACKNFLPFCIVTGKHIVQKENVVVPCCGFSANNNALMTRLKTTSTCPMCESSINVNTLQRKPVDAKLTAEGDVGNTTS